FCARTYTSSNVTRCVPSIISAAAYVSGETRSHGGPGAKSVVLRARPPNRPGTRFGGVCAIALLHRSRMERTARAVVHGLELRPTAARLVARNGAVLGIVAPAPPPPATPAPR